MNEQLRTQLGMLNLYGILTNQTQESDRVSAEKQYQKWEEYQRCPEGLLLIGLLTRTCLGSSGPKPRNSQEDAIMKELATPSDSLELPRPKSLLMQRLEQEAEGEGSGLD
ncbi:hypothetical protein MMC22_006933 [Lobaria immixta]|nr:hypothetical protein [Lobaria immixta]